jgi:hypothetical protein
MKKQFATSSLQVDDYPRAKSHIPKAIYKDTTSFAQPRRSDYGIEVSQPIKETNYTSPNFSGKNRELEEKDHSSIIMDSMNCTYNFYAIKSIQN